MSDSSLRGIKTEANSEWIYALMQSKYDNDKLSKTIESQVDFGDWKNELKSCDVNIQSNYSIISSVVTK